MKKLLFAAVKFILRSIAFATLVYCYSFLRHAAAMDIGADGIFIAVQGHILSDLLLWSVPLLVLSATISLFHILNISSLRFIARLVLLLVLAGGIFGVFMAWKNILHDKTSETEARVILSSHAIYGSDRLFIYTETVDGRHVRGVWYRSTAIGQSLVYGKNPQLVDGNRTLLVNETDARIPLGQLNGSLESLTSDTFLYEEEKRLSEIRSIIEQFLSKASSSLILSVVFALSLSSVVVSLWFWVRLSRWPLWNAVWTLLNCVFLFAGVALLMAPSSVMFLSGVHPMLADFAVPLFWCLITLLWSLLSLLLPPFKDWKREVAS